VRLKGKLTIMLGLRIGQNNSSLEDSGGIIGGMAAPDKGRLGSSWLRKLPVKKA